MISLSRLFGRKKEDKVKEEEKEKIDEILDIVKEIRDELKPLGPTGARISKLDMILGNITSLSPQEREVLKQELEALEIDEEILNLLKKPMTIEQLAKKIKRSYGYTAMRLRHLMRQGKVMRKRDAKTRKFVYLRVNA